MNSSQPKQMWTKEHIKDLRLRLGWSVAEFSRRLGCVADLVIAWEKGANNPSPDDLIQIEHLSFQITNYNMHIEKESKAEAFLNASAFEQVHRSQLNIYEMTSEPETTKTIQ
jgi:transcriptional regulator with XRE-family HTH domain